MCTSFSQGRVKIYAFLFIYFMLILNKNRLCTKSRDSPVSACLTHTPSVHRLFPSSSDISLLSPPILNGLTLSGVKLLPVTSQCEQQVIAVICPFLASVQIHVLSQQIINHPQNMFWNTLVSLQPSSSLIRLDFCLSCVFSKHIECLSVLLWLVIPAEPVLSREQRLRPSFPPSYSQKGARLELNTCLVVSFHIIHFKHWCLDTCGEVTCVLIPRR